PDFRQNIPEIINSMNRSTKAVFLASPYNPTGTILTEDEFLDVLKNTDKDVLIVMDEAYHEYLEDDRKIDTVSFIKENPNLVILRTFSKIYGLAGLRIGYGIADREIISILNKVRLPFNVNLIAQKAAVIALENDWYASRVRDEITAQKEKFYSFFDKSGIGYLRSHANFILVKTGDESNRIVEELLKSGFIVRPGLNLGIPGYIRVTISTPEINDRFLERFIEIYRMAYR
ncbi:MAG: aminotransferase class I/II-fold pyridoxal phosphate-dependent enzyme, partial [Actinobacteria bacterium]|nr:aminotransferase class I/II-fold pyridoxal phosphate-dependent enzyme [Actinomycetota bacterium]